MSIGQIYALIWNVERFNILATLFSCYQRTAVTAYISVHHAYLSTNNG